jgi:hypothetical protein
VGGTGVDVGAARVDVAVGGTGVGVGGTEVGVDVGAATVGDDPTTACVAALEVPAGVEGAPVRLAGTVAVLVAVPLAVEDLAVDVVEAELVSPRSDAFAGPSSSPPPDAAPMAASATNAPTPHVMTCVRVRVRRNRRQALPKPSRAVMPLTSLCGESLATGLCICECRSCLNSTPLPICPPTDRCPLLNEGDTPVGDRPPPARPTLMHRPAGRRSLDVKLAIFERLPATDLDPFARRDVADEVGVGENASVAETTCGNRRAAHHQAGELGPLKIQAHGGRVAPIPCAPRRTRQPGGTSAAPCNGV